MSSDDEAFYNRLILANPLTAKLTEQAVADALAGFALVPKTGMQWLTRAIQGAIYHSDCCPYAPVGCGSEPEPWHERKSDAKREITKLARNAEALWLGLFRKYNDYQSLLDDDWPIEPQFADAMAGLEWLIGKLGDAAENGENDGPRWREAKARALRMRRAECLSPVFQMAFGEVPAVNNWPKSGGGRWPDFYQRIVNLAFGEARTPDLIGVLKAARSLAVKMKRYFGDDIGAPFPPGILPKYPT